MADDESAPEALILATLEILDAHALLLDPGIVAEIEDALAVGNASARSCGRRRRRRAMPAENLAGIDLVEAVRIAPWRDSSARSLAYIAALSVATVMMTSFGVEIECLASLIAATMLARPEMPMSSNWRTSSGSILRRPAHIRAPDIAAEEQVERVARAIRHADHDVGVHDVVDQRDVLVADALDVVLAIAVLEHGRTFQRLDGDDLRAVPLLQIIAGGDRAGGAGRRDKGGKPVPRGRRASDRAKTRSQAAPVQA